MKIFMAVLITLGLMVGCTPERSNRMFGQDSYVEDSFEDEDEGWDFDLDFKKKKKNKSYSTKSYKPSFKSSRRR